MPYIRLGSDRAAVAVEYRRAVLEGRKEAEITALVAVSAVERSCDPMFDRVCCILRISCRSRPWLRRYE
jgi:hypothetical protein